MKVISLDIDEVLFPFMGPFLHWANPVFNLGVCLEQIEDYNIAKLIAGGVPVARKLIDEYYLREDLIQQIEPIAGAVEGVKRLAELGCTLICVTGRPEHSRRMTEAQVKRYFPAVSEIHFTHHYSDTPLKKVYFCKKANAVVHVDDLVGPLNDVIEAGMAGIFVKQVWKCTEPLHPRAIITESWDQIIQEVERLVK